MQGATTRGLRHFERVIHVLGIVENALARVTGDDLIVFDGQNPESILEKKAFDTLRGLLPMSTLGQVAFRGNAQAFEYLINRSAKHALGELRWFAGDLKQELDKEIPSLLLRVSDEKTIGLYVEANPGPWPCTYLPTLPLIAV